MFNKLFHSAFFKTLAVTAVGAAGPAVLSAIDHPSGGFAQALASNPTYGLSWTLVSYLAHNYYSKTQVAQTNSQVDSSIMAVAQAHNSLADHVVGEGNPIPAAEVPTSV